MDLPKHEKNLVDSEDKSQDKSRCSASPRLISANNFSFLKLNLTHATYFGHYLFTARPELAAVDMSVFHEVFQNRQSIYLQHAADEEICSATPGCASSLFELGQKPPSGPCGSIELS